MKPVAIGAGVLVLLFVALTVAWGPPGSKRGEPEAPLATAADSAWAAEYNACIASKYRVEERAGKSRDDISPSKRRLFERDCERSANRLRPQ